MPCAPLRNLIVINLDPVTTRSVSSLLEIPVDSLPKSTTGTVLAVGPGLRDKDSNLIPLSVVVGDRIIIGKGSGQPVTIDKEELIIVREDDIMVVLPK